MHILTELNSIVVNGICATNEWKRALALPKLTSNSLNILVRKSLRENEVDLVWNLLNGLAGLMKQYQYLSNNTILAFAKYFKNNPKEIPKHLDQFLTYCEKLHLLTDETTINELTDVLYKHGHHAELTNITYS